MERDEAEETKLVQELYQGFSRMEKRIEALETILLDLEKKDKKQ
jgi:phage shock protein B